MAQLIRVRTFSQQILLVAELQGQISDGHWENAKPHAHYVQASSATVIVDEEKQGLSFRPLRSYNFASRELLSVVQERMLNYVRFYMTYPHLWGKLQPHDVDMMDGCVAYAQDFTKHLADTGTGHSSQYFRERAQRVASALEFVEINTALLPVVNQPYHKPQLLADLKELSQLFNRTRTWELATLAT